MLPDRVSNPGPLTYASGALPIALRGPANRNIYLWLFDWARLFKTNNVVQKLLSFFQQKISVYLVIKS